MADLSELFRKIASPATRGPVSRIIAGLVAVSFAASYAVSRFSLLDGISSGMKTILLTVVLSLAAAILFPVKEEEQQHDA